MDGETPTIVLVDDASEVRLLVKTRLRISGRLQVVGEGADGQDAVTLAGEHRPDLLLLDVSMPVVDGLEALAAIREASPATKIVLYSGFEEQGLAARAEELGAAAFVEKSLPIEALIDRLVAIADDTWSPRPAAQWGEEVPAPASSVDQQVLDEHLERFREVFDQAAIGMATMTLTGTLVRVNDAFATLMRRPAASLVGQPYPELAASGYDDVAAAIATAREDEVGVARVEHDVAAGQGQAAATVVATAAAIRDSSGRPLYLFLQVQDITAERQAAEELRRSEERFRLLVEAVEDYAIFMLDPDGRVASWNAGAQRSQGYTADEIIGQHFRAFYPPDVAARGHPEYELEVALREGSYAEEGWRVRKDGTSYYASVVITAVYDDRGRHVGFAKVTRDITDRREADEVLRQSEQRFRLLVEAVEDYAIYMLDPVGRIVSWNAGAERIKGYPADEILGRHFRVFYPPEVAARRHPEHELEMALQDGHYEEEGWRVRKDGSRFWASVLITTIYNADGDHVGYAKITRDTSERRRLEQERERALEAVGEANAELEALNERLRRSAEDQAQFLAVTAHELRTPIGVLGNSAELLSQHWDALDETERQELFGAMTSSTGRLRRLLDDLLTASRLQARALSMQTGPVPLRHVVEEAAATCRRSWPGAEVVVEDGADLVVQGDHDRLVQALDNLLGNAVRHGEPPVHVVVQDADDHVDIRIRDSGSGVAPQVRPRLFERFATGVSKGGTGLGLFIVRELARAHGGDAFYDAEDGGAGAFVIRLPHPG
ncbi:PAS domain S-box protein [Nocardioides caldifontis]|uniref:PAS domain S-box protein n=1 Tax=Nocardioides caldifontis TaxID=2588938 RepID=UPI0011E04C51|nr:PAS domain S-box protein [Nocardioides caldifontis]